MASACPTPGGSDQDRQEPLRHTSASRRDITLGAAGIVIASHLPDQEFDTAAGEREFAAERINHLAARWEHIGPAQASAAALVIVQRLEAGTGGADTDMLYAQALAMHAQAEADRGRDELAARIAATARFVAASASRAAAPGSNVRILAIEAQTTAETTEGELYAAAAPRGDAAIEQLAAARRRAGRSATAARAGALEAYARAVRGDGRAVVLQVLDEAERIIAAVPESSGWPHFTPGHLHAFGGAALVRAGATREASEWLATADEELAAAALPGIQVANTLYWAHGAARRGDWDAAYSYAAGAVDAAKMRGIPAWLTRGVDDLTRRARNRGGDWRQLRASITA